MTHRPDDRTRLPAFILLACLFVAVYTTADSAVAQEYTPPADTAATLRLCNRSSDQTLFAAIAFWDSENKLDQGWTTEGWYRIDRGRCKDLPMVGHYRGDIYVYAYNQKGDWAGRIGAYFCIDSEKAFVITHGDTTACWGPTKRRVKMAKFKLGPGIHTYDFR